MVAVYIALSFAALYLGWTVLVPALFGIRTFNWEGSIEINVPQEKLWFYVSDFRGHLYWSEMATYYDFDTEQGAPGTIGYRIGHKEAMLDASGIATVVLEVEPLHRIRFSTPQDANFSSVGEDRLEKINEHTTKLHWSIHTNLKGRARLALRKQAYLKQQKVLCQLQLERLKTVSEMEAQAGL